MKKRNQKILAAGAAVLSLGLGLGVLEVMKRQELPSDAVIASIILLLPLVVYLIISGGLEEIRAPGGLVVNFRTATSERIRTDIVVEVTPMRPIKMVKDEDLKEIPEDELFQNPNTLLLIQEKEPAFFDLCGYIKYLNQRLGLVAVKYLISIDESGQFIWLIPMNSVVTDPNMTVEGKCNTHQLIDWIYLKAMEKIASIDGFVAKENSASQDWTRQKCLREMYDRSLEALPVVDKKNKLIGIVERSRIVDSIIVDIAGKHED